MKCTTGLMAAFLGAALAFSGARIALADDDGTLIKINPEGGNAGQVINIGGGGAGWGFVGAWPGANGLPQSALIQLVTELNMRADFTLTADEKTKIKAAQEELKAAQDAWRKEHKDDLAKVQKDLQDAFTGQDQEKIQAAIKAQQALNQTMPNTDKMDAAVRALFTDDQKKIVDGVEAERKAAMGNMRMQMRTAPAKDQD